MENTRLKIKGSVFLIVLLCCLSALGQGKNSIKIAGESVVESEQIVLGQIARTNDDHPRGDRLRSISLGYAPGIGTYREITRPQIMLAIKAAGFEDWEFSLETPPKIIIRRGAQTVPAADIREAVEKAVLGQFSGDGVSAEIGRIAVTEALTVPVGAVEIRASVIGIRSLFERFPVPVEVRVDGKTFKTFAVTAEVAAYAEVLVAATDLAIGKPVGETDVRLQRVRLEKPVTAYLRDRSMLRGVQMIKPVESGKALTADSFVAAVVVKLGDTVRIEANSGRMKVTASGEARANGRIGDRISVKNKQSGTTMQAVVVDQGLVKVLF